MIFEQIAILGSTICSVVIGTLVLMRGSSRSTNRAFFLFSLGCAVWIGSFELIVVLHDDLYLPILNIGGLFMVAGLTSFALVFPSPTLIPLRSSIFWSPLLIGGASLIITNNIIEQVTYSTEGEMNIIHGPLMNLWSSILLSYILISLILFIRSYKNANILDRERLWFVYIGITIFILCSILFDALLPGLFGIISLNYIGPLSASVFVGSTAYGILKHTFLDIKLVIQRSLIYSLSFFILALTYVILFVGFDFLLSDMAGFTAPVSAGIAMITDIYTLPYMEKYFRKVSDPFFFKDRYDYSNVLEELSVVLRRNLILKLLTLESLDILDRTFKPTYSYFTQSGSSKCFSRKAYNCTNTTEGCLDKEVHIIINSGDTVFGRYVLGPKKSGDAYTREDLTLLRTFGTNATVAFTKAELYQKLTEHSEKLEEKVEKRTVHLQALRDRQREFFDDISHALQTPLTVLKSSFEYLKEPDHSSSRGAYKSMDASINELSKLIHSILKIARIDTYSRDEDIVQFNLSKSLEKITEYVSTIASTKDIQLTTHICPGICFQGDESQLSEAVTNILSNAVKYTEGCPLRAIDVYLKTNETGVTIIITDTGVGMELDNVAKVFDRFYRSEDTKKTREGFGLGLAITKRIIQRHSGTIEVKSAPLLGTTVTINLPVVIHGADRS